MGEHKFLSKIAKLSPSPSLSWAELATFSINPASHPPTRTSLDFMFRAILRKQNLLVYSHKPKKNVFGPHPDPKNSAIGPKKAQNDPELS